MRNRVRRKRVAGESGPVMLLDRGRYRGRLAIVLGIVAAHHALQLREFAHHVGQQIGFGKHRRAVCQRRVGTEHCRDPRRQTPQSILSFGHRTELVVIAHAAELVDARCERLFAILFEKKLGVRKPCTQHAFIAADDLSRIVGFDVADQQKSVLQSAVRAGDCKVPLIPLHGKDEAFLRDFEKRRIESAGVDLGPFDQRGDFVNQVVRHDDFRARCGDFELRDDSGATFPKARDNLSLRGKRWLPGFRGGDR